MSVARALTLFFGVLSLDAIAAFVLLVVAGIIAPKGLGTQTGPQLRFSVNAADELSG